MPFQGRFQRCQRINHYSLLGHWATQISHVDNHLHFPTSWCELDGLALCFRSDSNQHSLFSCSVVSDSLPTHGLQRSRLPCPSPSPGACLNSSPSSRWCHPAISSSVVPFSSCLQSFPASRSFPMSQLFASGGHSIGASALASVLPMNIQGWFLLAWTGWISLLSKGLSRVFSNTTVRKHQFFSIWYPICWGKWRAQPKLNGSN